MGVLYFGKAHSSKAWWPAVGRAPARCRAAGKTTLRYKFATDVARGRRLEFRHEVFRS